MRICRDIGITESMTIFDAAMPPGKGALDPITVILRDFGGSGQIIVECYGAAWSHWFGAIGNCSLQFGWRRPWLRGPAELHLKQHYGDA